MRGMRSELPDVQDFKRLRVWHQAHRLSLNVHSSCDPKLFGQHPGKRTQTLKCADSIPTNISEGSAKEGPEFARYLDMAHASAKELENHLLFARDKRLISRRRFDLLNDSVEHVQRMLIKLIKAVRRGGR
jgi:four helix bundle protein